MSDKIITPYDIEQKIVQDYISGIKNKDICLQYDLTPPRLYIILNKYNIPKKGNSSHSRFGENIKCYICQDIKHQTLFPCVKGIYRTGCKKCHAKKEAIRRPNIPADVLKQSQIKTYKHIKRRKLDAVHDLIPLYDQIMLWVRKTTTRSSEKKFTTRKNLCRDILVAKCYEAKDKYPGILFSFIYDMGLNRGMIASLDRIDSSKGYTDENTQVIPLWLNSAKMDQSQVQIDDIIVSYVLNSEYLSEKYELLKTNREQPDWIVSIKH